MNGVGACADALTAAGYKRAAPTQRRTTLARSNVPTEDLRQNLQAHYRDSPPSARNVHHCFATALQLSSEIHPHHLWIHVKTGTKMMWWAVWCVAVVATGALSVAAPSGSALAPLSAVDWQQFDASNSDDESMANAFGPVSGRYSASTPWFYLLADVPRESQVEGSETKRSRSAFSVYPAMEVLQRGAYNNYLGRLAHANRDFLNRVGKRDPCNSPDCKLKN
ncbi:unnamed protein product, partial [Iphiclides podalirius]